MKFKAKPETSEISLDEAIALIVKEQEAKAEIEARLKNLKEVVKTYLKRRAILKYITEDGHSATYYSSQSTKLDKKAVRALLGDDFGRVVSFETVQKLVVK